MHPLILARVVIKAVLKIAIGLAAAPVSRARRAPGRLRVLYYHRVNDHPRGALGLASQEFTVRTKSFARQLEYLRRKGHPVLSAQDVEERLASGLPFPSGAVLLTFDDGYADNCTAATPILKSHGMSGLFFLTTDYLDRGESFPWDRGGRPEWNRPLSWEQVRAMAREGMAFGSHTKSHPRLDRIAGDALTAELSGSRRIVERETGTPVAFLAFPAGHVSAEVMTATREAGYRGAFTTIPGANAPGDDPYLLKRSEVSFSDPLPVFALKVSGALDVLRIKEGPAVRRIGEWLASRLLK